MSEQREKILHSACELFLADGMDQFSMRKLAREVGVTAPALYRHFDSKEHVLHEVLGEAYRRMAGHLYRALEGVTPGERLLLATEGYATFALDNPRLYDVLFASPELMGFTDVPDELESQGCAIGQFWNDRIRDCMDADVLGRGDPRSVSITMWAHAHGLISLYQRGLLYRGESLSPEEFLAEYRASVSRLMKGMRPDGALAELEG
jgi:AcrR family transcriptional regulator